MQDVLQRLQTLRRTARSLLAVERAAVVTAITLGAMLAWGAMDALVRFPTSLRLLARIKEIDPAMFTKSGLMVGLGETREEILQVMDDLRAAKVDFLTIGQYLQPTKKHARLDRFWTPEEFASLESIARAKGFLMVSASPLTRSSYHADSDFAEMKKNRAAKLG